MTPSPDTKKTLEIECPYKNCSAKSVVTVTDGFLSFEAGVIKVEKELLHDAHKDGEHKRGKTVQNPNAFVSPTENTEELERFHDFWEDLYQQWSVYGKYDKATAEAELYKYMQKHADQAVQAFGEKVLKESDGFGFITVSVITSLMKGEHDGKH